MESAQKRRPLKVVDQEGMAVKEICAIESSQTLQLEK
jgi:hypothetical protein